MSVAMSVAAFLSVVVTLAEFNSGLNPFLLAKARSVSETVKQNLEYASEIGIPFSEIRGVKKYLTDLTAEHKEISGISIVAVNSSVHLGESETLPLERESTESNAILLAQQTFDSLSKLGVFIFGSGNRKQTVLRM